MENALLVAALLACPVGMGLTMWWMGRGTKKNLHSSGSDAGALRAEQARLTTQIDQLESERAERTAGTTNA